MNPAILAKLILAAATVAAASALAVFFDVSVMTTDTAQYISVARHLVDGEGLKTSLIYFDVHHLIGGIPVEQTVWPPGFPVLIAIGSYLGVNLDSAPFVLSLLAFGLIPLCLFLLVRMVGYGCVAAAAAAGTWLLLGFAWSLVLAGTTEMPFILFTLVALVFLGRESDSASSRYPLLLLAGLFAGLSVAMRHSGIFFVAGLGAFYALRWALVRTRRSFFDLCAVMIAPSILTGAIFARNYVLTGSATGSTPVVGSSSPLDVAREFFWAMGKLFGAGNGGILAVGVYLLLFALAALLVYLLVAASKLRLAGLLEDRPQSRVPFLSLFYLAMSAAGLGYLSLTAAAGYMNDRYLLPLVPFILLSVLAALRSIGERYPTLRQAASGKVLAALALAVFAAGQAQVFAREWDWYRSDRRYVTIEAALDEKLDGVTVAAYLRTATGRDRPILAPNGQHLGAILKKPVLGLAAPLYTDRVWTTDAVFSLIEDYDVSHVVMFPELFDTNSPWDRNRMFFDELENGQPPGWLRPIHESDAILVYSVARQL